MSDKAAPKPSLRTRFAAWWEGCDPETPAAGAEAEDATPPAAEPSTAKKASEAGLNRHGKPLWNATRLDVAEKLWGRGFTTPGGEEHALYLVRPLGLNPAMSVLEIGAGLGGLCRAAAEKSGCWTTGLEASPLLAKIGMERSCDAEMAKRAPIRTFDPENFSYDKRVDALVCREAMFTVTDKDQLLDGMESRLKPRGQLILTDYVVAPDAQLRGLERWAAGEPQEPYLWAARDFTDGLAQRNLDLRIAEDVTDAHKTLIMTGLNAFTAYLTGHAMDNETKGFVLAEIELWARRVQAFEAGLRLYRFYALKPNAEIQ